MTICDILDMDVYSILIYLKNKLIISHNIIKVKDKRENL